MEYKGAKIQILDIPGLIAGQRWERGGKEVIGVVRSADMISNPGRCLQPAACRRSLKRALRCRYPDQCPEAGHHHQENHRMGGVRLNAVGTLDLDIDDVRAILSESKIMNADVLIGAGVAGRPH
jgi:ribosome-interacting GTPase 1